MKRTKTVAAAIVAASIAAATGVASALDVELPTQASDTAGEAVANAGQPDDPQANAAEHRQNTAEADDAEAAEAEKADAEEEGSGEENRPVTHGSVVSDFATTTELEGREKGEAISDLARTDDGKDGENGADAAAESASTDDDSDAERGATGKARAAEARAGR